MIHFVNGVGQTEIKAENISKRVFKHFNILISNQLFNSYIFLENIK